MTNSKLFSTFVWYGLGAVFSLVSFLESGKLETTFTGIDRSFVGPRIKLMGPSRTCTGHWMIFFRYKGLSWNKLTDFSKKGVWKRTRDRRMFWWYIFLSIIKFYNTKGLYWNKLADLSKKGFENRSSIIDSTVEIKSVGTNS